MSPMSRTEPPDLNASHVEIISIIPNRATVIHGEITRLDFSDIGRRCFLVDLVEEDDAEELARDFGCSVVDRVAVE